MQPSTTSGPTASVSGVSCADGDGSVSITLTAGDGGDAFSVPIDDAGYGGSDAPIDVPANQSVELVESGLDDGDHRIAVDTAVPPASEAEPENLADETRAVSCDPAPVGAYTNAKGSIAGSCSFELRVTASNAPVGGNTADLQPVDFALKIEPFADSGGDDPDVAPALADPITLDTFTLDAGTPTYERSFAPDEIGQVGLVTLTAGETVVASDYYDAGCVLSTAGAGSGEVSGPGVPNTGA